jgi:glutamyl-tRNA synthetase
VRLRVPDEGETVVEDLIRGPVTFPNRAHDDFVIARGDGTVLYNFAVAVDDAEMGITDVVRGDDHLSNTPKQLLVLAALGHEAPRYAHLPLLHGPDGRKLSKRHGAITVDEFRRQGYLPDALVNFLALLGWSYDDRTTIMSRRELVERFSLDRVGASAATFDYDKLDWMNGVYLRGLEPEAYADALLAYLREQGYDWDEQLVRRTAPLVQVKLTRLGEFPGYAGFFFDRVEPDPAELNGGVPVLAAAREALAEVEPFTAEPIEGALRGVAERLELSPRKAFHPIRVAVTGSRVSPGLFESLELLGRDESLRRLASAARAAAA